MPIVISTAFSKTALHKIPSVVLKYILSSATNNAYSLSLSLIMLRFDISKKYISIAPLNFKPEAPEYVPKHNILAHIS